MSKFTALALVCSAGMTASVLAQAITGPSTLQSPYMLPATGATGVKFVSIISNGNGLTTTAGTPDETYALLQRDASGNWNPQTNSPYRLVGIPDGMGAYRSEQDIAEGTFTLLVNHEIGNTVGPVQAYGLRGSHVSRWRINADPTNLLVTGGASASDTLKLWNSTTNTFTTYNSSNLLTTSNLVLGRHCSGDLALPSAYRFGNLGTDARLFMNGEEIGADGRAAVYVLSGPEAGTTYQLPALGRWSWENSVASPYPQAKTIVVGPDDATPGEVLFYIGTKTDTGNDIERAGLTNGRVWGMVINGTTTNTAGQKVESSANALGNGTLVESATFTMYQYSDLTNKTGAQLQAETNANGVMNWLRPEDAAWDLKDPSVCYFLTTNGFGSASRLWKVKFTDITQPELGGTVSILVDGQRLAATTSSISSGSGLTTVEMMDNMSVSRNGLIYIQEDVGNNPRLGRMWQYDTKTDAIKEVGISDSARFISGSSKFLTQDEETSGIFDARDILGPGWYLLCMQAHYGISTNSLVEGGQLMAAFFPDAVKACEIDIAGPGQNTAQVDGQLTADDIIVFLNWFFAADARANIAGPGQSSTPDTQFTADDIIVFLNGFFAGC